MKLIKVILLKKLKFNFTLTFRCAVYESERAKLKHLIEVHEDGLITRIVQNKLSDRNLENEDMYMSHDSSDAIFLAAGGAVKVLCYNCSLAVQVSEF